MPIIELPAPGTTYAHVADLRGLGITAEIADAGSAGDALATASRWVDSKTGQTTYGYSAAQVATETIRDGFGEYLVLPAPVADITAVTPDGGSPLDAGGYTLESPRLLRWLRSWTGRAVAITGTWGYAVTPALVRQATALYAAHLIVTDPVNDGVKSEQIGNYTQTLGTDGQPSLYDRAVKSLKDGGFLIPAFA